MSSGSGSGTPSPSSRPASARLPFNYQRGARCGRVRWSRRRSAATTGAASIGGRAFPGWPIDLSADLLDDLRADVDRASARAARPRGRARTTSIRREGLTNLVTNFLPLEEAVGARSTSYVVPCAWRIDHGLVGELIARGHEVGVHGYDHSNTTPFAAGGRARAAAGRRPRLCRPVRRDRVPRALAAADPSAAARSRRPLSLRQQHSDLRRAVSDTEQRLRDRPAVCHRGHRRAPDLAASRRESCGSSATRRTRSSACGSNAPI